MICNSTPLITFGKLNKLDLLLKIYNNLIIPKAVYIEVVEKGLENNTPDSFLVKDLIEKNQIIVKNLNQNWEKKSEFLRKTFQLGKGEAEAITLALQEEDKNFLTDDKTAKKVARLYEIKTQGSLKVLLLAFKSNFISEKEVHSLLTEMTSNKFRVSAEIINKFWILFDKLKNKK